MQNFEYRIYHKNKKPSYIVLLGNTRPEADKKLAKWYPDQYENKEFSYIGIITLDHSEEKRGSRQFRRPFRHH